MDTNMENMEKDLSGIIRRNRKRSQYLKYIGISAIVAGISLSMISVSQLTGRQIASDLNSKADRAMIASLCQSNEVLTNRQCRIEYVTARITDFLEAEENSPVLDNFFADTVRQFYSRQNVPLDKIRKEKMSVRSLDLDSKAAAVAPEISVCLKDSAGAEVFVTRGKEVYQIRLNGENRVYFIRKLGEK